MRTVPPNIKKVTLLYFGASLRHVAVDIAKAPIMNAQRMKLSLPSRANTKIHMVCHSTPAMVNR